MRDYSIFYIHNQINYYLRYLLTNNFFLDKHYYNCHMGDNYYSQGIYVQMYLEVYCLMAEAKNANEVQ